MSGRIAYALLLLLLLALAVPTAYAGTVPLEDSGDKPYILVTLPVLADIISGIAGERATVESLVSPGIAVITYELTPRDSARIEEASIFIYVGYGSEEVLGEYAKSIREYRGVVRLLDVLEPAGIASEDNPYFWLDPLRTANSLDYLVDILSRVDPEGRQYYESRAAQLRERLLELDEWIKEKVSLIPEDQRLLVTVRDTMRYYAERYGFEVVGFIVARPGTYEPTAGSVTRLLDAMIEKGVRVAFIEYEEAGTTLREVLETISEEAGVRTVEFLYIESLAPQLGVSSYEELMKANTMTLVENLARGRENGQASAGESVYKGSLFILEPFRYDFMIRGTLTLIAAMAASALVGSFAVIRGWAIFGDALAHGALAGLVVAYFIGASFYFGALAAGLFVALSVSAVERRTRLRADVVIAVTFVTMLSISIALLSRAGGATISIEDVLFADVTAVSPEMMARTVGLSLAIIAFTIAIGRHLLVYVVDPVIAAAMGVRTGILHYSLLALLALTIVTAFFAIGYVPAIAAMMVPPATAFIISRRPVEFMVKSVGIAVVSAIAGVYASYYLDVNAGASAILVSAGMFAVAVATHKAANSR
ncbi:MAG: zinc ABC transporter substrate-binding protein [Desulfurococcales archaeon]|nr:zinc ABC transporter substrate-binding protein [Desulfurococcales archaeon]